MTEAPEDYPDVPDDDRSPGDDKGVEGMSLPGIEQVATGDLRVDEVLASLDGLDAQPVSEHAAVFERAHEQLRGALDPDRRSA